jgi:hypothetical protein
MLPKQIDIEVPLLKVLIQLGGKGKPPDIYPLITKAFPEVPQEDFLEQISTGGKQMDKPNPMGTPGALWKGLMWLLFDNLR